MADIAKSTPVPIEVSTSRATAALLDAAGWAAVVAVLCVPILTFITVENASNQLTWQYYWWPLVMVPVVFFGRLLASASANDPRAEARGDVVKWYAARAFVSLAMWFLVGLVLRIVYPFFGSGDLVPQVINIGVLVLAVLTFLFLVSGATGEAAYGTIAKYLANAYGAAMLIMAVALPWLPFSNRYILDTAILIVTYVMLGWGLNIVVGLAGLLDLGYVAFYAVGAYSYSLLATTFGLSFWICLPMAGILAAFWGLILGFPVLRLRGDYLAIVTLAFGEIIRLVLINWGDLTSGPRGIQIDPSLRPGFFGLEFKSSGPGSFAEFFHIPYAPIQRIAWLYYIILAMALLTNIVSMRLRRLPIGRAWEALREDEIACRSLGINTTNTKLTAFALGAMFAGFAGAFFATKQGFISPESFTFLESATILAIVVLGGLGSQLGIVVSAVVMIGGVEALRNLDFLRAVFGDGFDPTKYRMLLFGLALVVVMVWRPRGIVSSRAPSVALGKSRAISGDLVKEGHG